MPKESRKCSVSSIVNLGSGAYSPQHDSLTYISICQVLACIYFRFLQPFWKITAQLPEKWFYDIHVFALVFFHIVSIISWNLYAIIILGNSKIFF